MGRNHYEYKAYSTHCVFCNGAYKTPSRLTNLSDLALVLNKNVGNRKEVGKISVLINKYVKQVRLKKKTDYLHIVHTYIQATLSNGSERQYWTYEEIFQQALPLGYLIH